MSWVRRATHINLAVLTAVLAVTQGCDVKSKDDVRILAQHEPTEALRRLLKRNPDLASARVEGDKTALHVAARHGNAGTVKLLLDAGADVDARDEFGRTALHYAVYHHADVVKVLLLAGANPDVEDRHGFTPVKDAHVYENEEVIAVFEGRSTEGAAAGGL